MIAAGSPATVLTGPTTDRELVGALLDGLEAVGETQLFDAIGLATASFVPGADRRAVVVLTDGADTASVADVDTASASLVAADAETIVIALDTPDQDLSVLQQLTAAVGGTIEVAPDEASLAELYRAAATDLTNQWRITFATTSSFERSRIDVALDIDGSVVATSVNVAVPANALEPVTTTPSVPPPATRVVAPAGRDRRRRRPVGGRSGARAGRRVGPGRHRPECHRRTASRGRDGPSPRRPTGWSGRSARPGRRTRH